MVVLNRVSYFYLSVVQAKIEGNEVLQTPEPSRGFKVGDLVHVYNGTSAGTRGYKTIAYMGTVVGFDEHQRKWLVCCVFCLAVSLLIVSVSNFSYVVASLGSQQHVGEKRATQSCGRSLHVQVP